MKKIKFLFTILFMAAMIAGCSKEGIDDDTSFVNSSSPSSNTSTLLKISNDNSGNVEIRPSGQGTSYSVVYFGDGPDSAIVAAGNNVIHSFAEGSYTVKVIYYDIAGRGTTADYPFTITYRVPENLVINIGSDMRVSAEALYANSFLVFYGDVANEVGTPLEVGDVLPPHIYPAGGPYDLRVIAQSGGAATLETTKTLFGFPLDFESATMDYFFGTFGNAVFSKVANPFPGGTNTSAQVGKYEKPTGAESWSGTYSPLNIPINFAYGNKVKILVYNPDPANIGKLVNVELESEVAGTGGVPNGQAVIKSALTTSGAWEELTFDYSTLPAIGSGARFNQLVLRFNDAAGGAGETIYMDNIRITN